MAVETILGTFIKTKIDATPQKIVRPQNHGGRVRSINDVAELPAASDIASTISWGPIPLRAVILGASRQAADALGASTTLQLGVKTDATKGIATKTAALIAATSTAAATSLSCLAAVNIDQTGKPLWEILGLAADPGGDAELVTTLAGAAGAGTVALDLLYVVD